MNTETDTDTADEATDWTTETDYWHCLRGELHLSELKPIEIEIEIKIDIEIDWQKGEWTKSPAGGWQEVQQVQVKPFTFN